MFYTSWHQKALQLVTTSGIWLYHVGNQYYLVSPGDFRTVSRATLG